MIKLQDFAVQQHVTDRQIQRLLKKYEKELEGLYQRQGPNGTWLSDEACEILRGKMKKTATAVYEPDPAVGRLQEDLLEAKALAREYWDQLKAKERSMGILIEENKNLSLKASSVARLEADNELAREKVKEADQKALEARREAQEAQEGLVRAQEAYEKDLRKKSEQIEAWEQYAADLQQYYTAEAAYQKRWFKRKKDKPVPPVPPVLQED